MKIDRTEAYDVVVATRNRADALRASLPLVLGQDPPPQHLIVVDSSPDPDPVSEAVADAANPQAVKVSLINSDEGLTVQRNAGLKLVTAPIVFFPDDDALWHPEYARRILEVFAQDTEHNVAAVGGREVRELPGSRTAASYSMSRSRRILRWLTPYRARFERKWFPEPLVLAARAMMDRHSFPPWVDFNDIVAVEYIAGFRMSFRTPFIAEGGFDRELRRYALYEDADVSLRAWHRHLVLANHRATVVHHKSPGGREIGWRDGFLHVVNYAYVVCKHSPPGSRARLQLIRWAWYRFLLYAVRSRSAPSLSRSAGAFAGIRAIRALIASDDDETLTARYRELSVRAEAINRT